MKQNHPINVLKIQSKIGEICGDFFKSAYPRVSRPAVMARTEKSSDRRRQAVPAAGRNVNGSEEIRRSAHESPSTY